MFLDFEKAFASIEWNFIHKSLETLNFGLELRHWIKEFYTDISSCVLNNGYALKRLHLQREVRQCCPLLAHYSLLLLSYSQKDGQKK